MGISIDVQGSLFPNLLTMITQLIATGILFLAMKKLLWKPVREILEKRADVMQASLAEAEKTRIEASQNLEEAKSELKKAKEDSVEIVAAAKNEATALKNEILADANRQAQNKISEADRRIESAVSEMKGQLHDEIVSVAMTAVEKLLGEKATSADDAKAISAFVDEVKD